MVKIRLEGTSSEVAESVKAVETIFNLLSISDEYQNRRGRYPSQYVRVYADAEIKTEEGEK